MDRYIIITSIFSPSEAIRHFAGTNLPVVVVGDKKAPEGWSFGDVKYLSIDTQKGMGFRLTELLPYHHYGRKMLGYLYAIENGANEIYDTDDDNFPNREWGFPSFAGDFSMIPPDKGFINVFQFFTGSRIWPRGFPLNHILDSKMPETDLLIKKVKVGVWQGLIDEDTDVDSIYRLTSNETITFIERPPVVLGKKSICPFNSQNTLFRKELFPLLYLPSEVTFRFTDILRGLVAQPIMWLYDYYLGFTGPSVIQKRNPHDLMKDFKSEIQMFLYAESVPEIVSSVITSSRAIGDNLFDAYAALQRRDIVTSNELKILEAWLYDIQRLSM
jgi:hypothetical protein